MDGFRYSMAVLVLVVWPAALVFWFLVHPFVGFWRRLGPRVTYGVVFAAMIVTATTLFLLRSFLLAVDFGTHPLLIAASVVPLLGWVEIARRRRRVLKTATLAGLPEIAPDRHPSSLLTGGIYGSIRHPRYVEIFLGLLFFTLLTNFLALYVLLVVAAGGLYLIVLLEERELRARFGNEYLEYSQRVPRFLPRRHKDARDSAST